MSKLRVIFDRVPDTRYYVINVFDEKREIVACYDPATNFFAEIDNLDYRRKYCVEETTFYEAGTTTSNLTFVIPL